MAQTAGKFTWPRMFDPRHARVALAVPYLSAHCTWVYLAQFQWTLVGSHHSTLPALTLLGNLPSPLTSSHLYSTAPNLFYRYLALSLSAKFFLLIHVPE